MRIDPGKSFGSRECPGCAMDVEANHNRCPICGYEFPNPTPRQTYLKWIGAILMLLLLLFVLSGIF